MTNPQIILKVAMEYTKWVFKECIRDMKKG